MQMEKLRIKDFTDYRFLSGLCFSPSGEKAAFFSRKANLGTNGYDLHLHLCHVHDGTVELLLENIAADFFCWEDDDTLLVPLLATEEERRTVASGELLTSFYRLDVKTKACTHSFSVPTNAHMIQKLAEGKYLLRSWFNACRPDVEHASGEEKERLLKKVQDDSQYEILDEIPFWWDRTEFTNKRRNRLYTYDLASGALHAVTDPLFDAVHLAVSKDGRKVAVAGQWFDSKRLIEDGIYLHDLATGEVSVLVEKGLIRICGMDIAGDRVLFAGTEMRRHGMYENPQFYEVGFDGGEYRLVRSYDRSIGDMVVTDCKFGGGCICKAMGETLYFLSTERYSTVLRRLNKDGTIDDLSAENGAVNFFDISGNHAVYAAMRGLGLQELYLLDLNTEKETRLTNLNESCLSCKTLSPYEHFTFQNTDGVELDGWVLRPVDFREDRRYPCILDIHGGPPGAYGEVFLHEMQCWANEGFFVCFSNPRGGEGRGNAFMDIRGRWGEEDYRDLMEFMDQVLIRYPSVDAQRLGVTGGSYGGYMTNWIIGHTDRFRAAAAQRSVSNLISMVGHSGSGYTYTLDQINAGFWEGVGIGWYHSPLKYAKNAVTPTLFIHSDRDRDCALSEGLQMFTALKMVGCEARMCIFKDECHDLSRTGRPMQRIRRLEEITRWFHKHLD